MLSFDNIAKALLKEKGYEVFECNSDEEAVIYARELKKELGRSYDVPKYIKVEV